MINEIQENQPHDFVIVGSGAGGGPLAANLALAGHTVLLIEAGEDHINDNYRILALHPRSTEDPQFSWEFFVKHYNDDNRPYYTGTFVHNVLSIEVYLSEKGWG